MLRTYNLRPIIFIIVSLLFCGLAGTTTFSLAAGDKWEKESNMPTARMALTTSVVDGKIYAIGGYSGNLSGMSTVEVYDPVTDTWEKKADMTTGRGALAASATGGKLYAMGGANGGQFLQTVEEYDTGFAGQGQAVDPMEKLVTMWGKIRGQH